MEQKMSAARPIGVFDSGLGGISVLAALRDMLPNEDFIYYGDAANAPYGDRSEEDILQLTLQAAEHLVAQNVKALVIACNTATSAAVTALRRRYAFPIIGMEPALKPAAQACGNRVLVMATQGTLRQQKFAMLLETLGNSVKVNTLPCPGLVELIEDGGPDDPRILPYLKTLLQQYVGKVDALVLGCTHYPFVQTKIRGILGNVAVFDGRQGTARQLARRLKEENLLREDHWGSVILQSSNPEALPLASLLLEREQKERSNEVQ